VEKTQRLLHGPLKHVRAAALAAALLPLASVAVTPASAQGVPEPCPSGGTLSGFVWSDTNNNGIQDPGEPGIAGASVSLGSFTTFTDATGFYSFDFGAGFVAVCQVSVQIPNNAQPSPTNAGTNDSIDSDGARDTTTGSTSVATVTILPNGSADSDFGFYQTPIAQVGTGTPGYWKNHPEAWPVTTILVGGVWYSKADAIAWLDQVGKDKTTTMFSSLVSAKLNLIVGNDPSCVASTITLADAWMLKYGPVGSGVQASSFAWKVGEPLHRIMDNYNNGMLCAPHRN